MFNGIGGRASGGMRDGTTDGTAGGMFDRTNDGIIVISPMVRPEQLRICLMAQMVVFVWHNW